MDNLRKGGGESRLRGVNRRPHKQNVIDFTSIFFFLSINMVCELSTFINN